MLTSYANNATTVTDQASKVRRSITDALGRLIRVDEPDASGNPGTVDSPLQPTSYLYDVLGNLVRVTQGGQTRYFMYDSLKRLIRVRNPEQDTNAIIALSDPVTGNSQWCLSYEYDENSNLHKKTDSRNIVTQYDYDALNRVINRTYFDGTPTVSYTYDGQSLPGGYPAAFARGFSTGKLVAVTSGGTSAGNYTGYDRLGQVTSSYQQTDAQNYGFSYGYDLAGEMLTENYPSGRAITNAYDLAGRLTSTNGQKTGEQNKTYASQFSFAAHGAVSAIQLGNGKWEHTVFNTRLQPTLIGLGASSTDSSILKLEYEYTATCQTANNGNVLKQTITAPGLILTQNYCYDALNRIASANENSGSSWTQTYDYDRYGNRAVRAGSFIPTSRQTPTSNSPADLPNLFGQSNNRIIAILPGEGVTQYGYDFAGNLTSMPDKVSGPSDTITYDAENRQLTFNGTVGQYFYDGDGHRVKKIDGLGTTIFVYNAGGQLIAEYHSDPVPPAAGGGGTSYLTSDHLGSTRVVTRADGSVKARYDYVPFGEELGSGIGGRTAAMGYSAADSTKQKFTQKERDSESGLDYFLARYYSSAQGRFTSPDEFTGGPDELYDFAASASDNPTFYADLHEPQSFNKYQYCYNNPLAYVDPNGHQSRTREPRVQIEVHRTTYAVQGKTAAEAMNNATTTNTHPGGLPGLTTWNYQFTARETYSAPTRSGSEYTSEGKVTGVDVKTDITVDTPRWEGAANAPQEEQKQWNDYTQKLNEHEQGHVEIARQGAPEVPRAIAGATVTGTDRTPRGAQAKARENLHREENRRFTGADNRIKQRSEDYDKRTDHGRKPQ